MASDDRNVDLINRDPNDMNAHIKVEYEDVFAEPDGTHSINCVWQTSFLLFNCGKNCCYKFVTAMCGIFIALCWGCELAMVTFEQVWCTSPALRIFSIYAGCMQKFIGTCSNCCLAPICETCGLYFSRITVVNRTDKN